MRFLNGCLVLFCLVLSVPSVANSNRVEQVEQFVAAFNAQDAERMAQYVTEDVQWLSVNGDKITVETSGKDNLVTAMSGYFESCPSCQSQLANFTVLGSRLSVVEEASWRQKGKPRSQKSLAVYEFSNNLIHRVYYFPAE
ncbi:nuclear transport factor 2 family protein [Idiomarina piscisalsi]|uniref:nuclear transport factor 2 family protein n=1 Tax=Idiomarina piscisalsi TaxID=1096243 RepID=UPI00137F8576|nr:nuclear transport factor 2 family protein [Idiomarina piscisalsi]MTJ00948.1 nuclear transport factor 2 family protein [Idiomarina piscisalsi]